MDLSAGDGPAGLLDQDDTQRQAEPEPGSAGGNPPLSGGQPAPQQNPLRGSKHGTHEAGEDRRHQHPPYHRLDRGAERQGGDQADGQPGGTQERPAKPEPAILLL